MPAESELEALYKRLDRLTVAIEQLIQMQTRKVARDAHYAAKAAEKAGPTTPSARAAVVEKLRKKGLL